MRIYLSDPNKDADKPLVFSFPDDTSFMINEPHGFLRVVPNPKLNNHYFNMAYVMAITSDDA